MAEALRTMQDAVLSLTAAQIAARVVPEIGSATQRGAREIARLAATGALATGASEEEAHGSAAFAVQSAMQWVRS